MQELYPELIAVAVEADCKATDSTITTDDGAQGDESVFEDPHFAADAVDQQIEVQDQELGMYVYQ